MGLPQQKVKIEWSSNFAYAIGVITSDGCLSRDKRHIFLKSADKELVEKFKIALNIKNKIGKGGRGGVSEKRYFQITFGDIVFYKFLNEIGLTQTKSKSIKKVNVPKKFFADFVRGLFDGDGSFYTFWDKRWPNSFGFRLSFASASLPFLEWLKDSLVRFYGVSGFFHKGKGVMNLEYTKGDSKKLFFVMYRSKDVLFLNRKYYKIKSALEKDKFFGLRYLQKPRSLGSSVVRALP
ncbi:MAG: LAGLIDADG family homing endonuclease [Candidatus Niyogibacteria bacterium]|nr:MAG: LAGLIDADG family homing endonuclease [Candidatus Niyogibacteria bacterium]